MSFVEHAPRYILETSSRPVPRRYRAASEAGRLLVCKIVAFFADEGCQVIPTPNWLAVAVGGNGRTMTLEVLDDHEADPRLHGRTVVRSIDDARAAGLRYGVIEDFSAGAVA